MSKFSLIIDIKRIYNSDDKSNSEEDIFYCNYITSEKFKKDKIDYNSNEYRIILDGVVLNKIDLLKKTKCSKWIDCLLYLYKLKGNTFFSEFKGTFYGFLFEKRKNKWIIFSDHIGSKPLYYSYEKNKMFISNSFYELTKSLKQNNVTLSLNHTASYQMLTYGYVFEGLSLSNQVFRIRPGFYILIDNDDFYLKRFFGLNNEPNFLLKESDIIDELDRRFKKTVRDAFEKDKEYNFKHICALSGGLDSRMTSWVAHELGFTDQLNITFSQSDYLDEKIAKKIAEELRHEWLFKSLDNGLFLRDIEKITKISGQALYYGLAHGYSMYKYIDFNNLGILHSGQLGDVIISTFFSSLNTNQKGKLGDGAYSRKLLEKIKDMEIDDYKNEEIFKLTIRGFYGANQGLIPIQQKTETYSPFYDIDFMNFCLSIPVDIRFQHRLYKKWIIKKYPMAARYIWEKTGLPVDYKYNVRFRGKSYPISKVPQIIQNKLRLRSSNLKQSKNHMNPLEYYYYNNYILKDFLDNFYYDNLSLIQDYDLLNDCQTLYLEGNAFEKNQVLTLLASIKYLL